MDSQFSLHISWWTRTLLVAVSLACLEMSFVVKGPGAVILLFRLEYKTSVVCHNVNTQKVKISRRDRSHWVGRCGAAPHTLTLFKTNVADFPTLFKTEFRFLIPCLRHLTRNHTLCKTIIDSETLSYLIHWQSQNYLQLDQEKISCLRQKLINRYPD